MNNKAQHNDCKECLNSRLGISKNGYKAICTLSAKESNDCLLNDKCKFEGKRTMTNGEAIQIIKSISQWEYWQGDTLEAFILAIKALETFDGIKHSVYRNEMCDRAGKCYDYFGYHCAGCNGSKMRGDKNGDDK